MHVVRLNDERHAAEPSRKRRSGSTASSSQAKACGHFLSASVLRFGGRVGSSNRGLFRRHGDIGKPHNINNQTSQSLP